MDARMPWAQDALERPTYSELFRLPLTTKGLQIILAARDKFPLWDSNGNRV
jgi:hypothetical protein